MTTLAFAIKIKGLKDRSLVVRSFEGHETLSDGLLLSQPYYGFRYEIELASRLHDLNPNHIVDGCAEFMIWRNNRCVQRTHGIIRSFVQGDIGHTHTFYSLTLVPAIERLSLRHNSRIFQHKTVPEIISILLQEMNIEDYAFALSREYSPREFCVQYRETDLAFVQRLAAEEGLIYRIEHKPGIHTVIFTDSATLFPHLVKPVAYNAQAGGVSDTPYIFAFQKNTKSDTSGVTLHDHSFKKPTYRFTAQAQSHDLHYQREGYDYFDFPGRYKDDTNGKVFSRVRLEFLRRETHIALAKSNHPSLRAGCSFSLAEHLNTTLNKEWNVVSVMHKGTQPQALEESATEGATTYHNSCMLIPAKQNWQATPHSKPCVDGPMIATVVGPEGEEIYCDEHGRVKVYFPWDRYAKADEHSSCWVCVSQGWAGTQYGMMALPRIGHDVIVSFLHGDPDQPIITGRTYHATNVPPYSLPDHKTKTVLRSETHQGTGFNELSFEDQADKEKVYLHAQKDFETKVLHDHVIHIMHDKHLLIENDSFTQVKNTQHLIVDGESRTQIKQDQTLIVEGSTHQKADHSYTLQTGNEVHIKSGAKIVIEAGSELTLKAGGSFIKIDASGLSLVGATINLNSGGNPSSGLGFSGAEPLHPLLVAQIATQLASTPSFNISPVLLQKAENSHAPTVKTCSTCEDKK